MNKRKILYLLAILVIASVIAIFGFDLLDSSVSVSYKDFRLALDSGAIESAQINPNTIKYTLKNDSTLYSVINPCSPNLLEELLLNDVAVKSDNTDINAIGDMVFNIFFLAFVAQSSYQSLSNYTG